MPLSGYLFSVAPQDTVTSSTVAEIDVIVDDLMFDVEVELQ